jgi:hypothetical protein
MNPQPVTVNRALVGIIGVVLLGVAGGLALTGAEGSQEMWAGACLKVGLVMSAFWLALPVITKNPELGRVSLATLVVGLAIALIVARTKVPLKVVIPVLLAFLFVIRILRPRNSTAVTRRRPYD